MPRLAILTQFLFLALASSGLAGDWLSYSNETAVRMPTGLGLNVPAFTTLDPEDKNYAWGDVDKDGDVDLVCVRKQAYIEGRRRNVLFINEGIKEGHQVNGVLVDRSAQFASEANDGGQGFLDLTDDRDVVLVDVNGDGWLDMVTATTYGQGLPKNISHPRVYINEQEIDGVWQGFRYEAERTPTLPVEPNFCGIGVGDVTGDDAPDLYFIDYENSLEDRLWINNGQGMFSDESEARMTYEMRESEFGTHAVIADMNGDGAADVVKDRANGAPYRISISYNSPSNEGVFNAFETVYSGSPYYVEVADLNNDGLLDIALQDDGIDRYYLNQGNGPDGLANFVGFPLPPASNGFEGTMELADLDNDTFIDQLITDETVNPIGTACQGNMKIWRNSGTPPNVTFSDESTIIPVAARTGTSDVAPMDINGDGWLDLVIGTCSGTTVWMAEVGLAFSYPAGLADEVIDAGTTVSIIVDVSGVGPGVPEPGSGSLHYAVNGGSYTEVPMGFLGGSVYQATLPPVNCLETLSYYFSAVEQAGQAVFTDPPNAPGSVFTTIATNEVETTTQDFELDATGWDVVNDESLSSGAWEVASPVGTIFGANAAAPDSAGSGNLAFVTQNCPEPPTPCEDFGAGDADVDGGPTHVLSPLIDLAAGDAIVQMLVWFFSSDDDKMSIAVSNDGGDSWSTVQQLTGTGGGWQPVSFRVGNFVTPSSNVRVRVSVSDDGAGSIVEGGVDLFSVDTLVCEQAVGVPAASDWGMLVMVLLLLIAGTNRFQRPSTGFA